MQKDKRNSSIELLRIISMIMIIMHHYIFYGVQQSYNSNISGVIYSSGDFIHKIVCNLMLPGGVVGVAIFFLIAGYFGISSDKVNFKSIRNIVIPVLTYSVVGTAIWFGLVKANILCATGSIKTSFLSGIFPISNVIYWFASVYILIMLMKPIVNQVIRFLDWKKSAVIFCVLIICYSLMRITVAHYLGLWNGLIFYFLGATIKIYEDKFDGKPRWMYLFLGIIGWLGYAGFSVLGLGTFGNLIAICVMGTISALGFSVYFIDCKEWFNNKINYIASLTFGIYLFHEYPLLREVLWEKIFHVAKYQFPSNLFLIYALLTVCSVFIIGCIVEAFRKRCQQLIENANVLQSR